MGEQHGGRDGAQEGRLAGHVRPGDDADADPVVEAQVVADAAVGGIQERVAQAFDGETRSRSRIRPAALGRSRGKAPHGVHFAGRAEDRREAGLGGVPRHGVESHAAARAASRPEGSQRVDVRRRERRREPSADGPQDGRIGGGEPLAERCRRGERGQDASTAVADRGQVVLEPLCPPQAETGQRRAAPRAAATSSRDSRAPRRRRSRRAGGHSLADRRRWPDAPAGA